VTGLSPTYRLPHFDARHLYATSTFPGIFRSSFLTRLLREDQSLNADATQLYDNGLVGSETCEPPFTNVPEQEDQKFTRRLSNSEGSDVKLPPRTFTI
jgi:hypothetical protein